MSSLRAHSNENESFYQFLIKHLFNRPGVAGAVLGCISSFGLGSLIHLDRPGVARAVSLSYLDSKLFLMTKLDKYFLSAFPVNAGDLKAKLFATCF